MGPLRLPAGAQGSSGHSQVSELIACLPVLLSICQFCGHAGEKGGEMEFACVCLCVRLLPRNQRGSLRHDPSASWPKLLGEAAQLSSPPQLPLISPFFVAFIPLCVHPVISVPVQSHSSSEPSFLSGPELTREKGARLPERIPPQVGLEALY